MPTYFAIVHKDKDSAYGLVFPDVPGCFAAGDTFEEAVDDGRKALREHFAALADTARQLPAPRTFEDLMNDPEVQAELGELPLVGLTLRESAEAAE